MGFWQPGYWEFHEPTGIEREFTPSPPVYPCEQCSAVFDTFDSLKLHRFDKHPIHRPALFIQGKEVGNAPTRIASVLKAADVETDKAMMAVVNGQKVSPSRLGGILAKINAGVVSVELLSDHVSAAFKLHFEVAREDDLVGVETSFLNVAKGARLDLRAIEHFIALSNQFTSAIAYCGGICEYLYGVLAKDDQPDRAGPSASYVESYNVAIGTLAIFHRPLSDAICSLIDFHFNHFPEAQRRGQGLRVAGVASRFQAWVSGNPAPHHTPDVFRALRLERLLTDIHTERILTWAGWSLEKTFENCVAIETLLTSGVSTYDAAKLRILLSEAFSAAGDHSRASFQARELLNAPTLGVWAERKVAGVSDAS